MSRKLRLGIDVGGTFTDVVAVDAQSREVVARLKLPTTHNAPGGVAAGIVEGIGRILAEHQIDPDDVAFIAHSTTQATNALLEGDVASVGVLGLLDALAPLERAQMRFPALDLAPGVPFRTQFAFARAGSPEVGVRLSKLLAQGVQAVAVTQAFSVDRPDGEQEAAHQARTLGLSATAGHDVSATYGLRARTRTAALNAAILPKMVNTARMTQDAVQRAGIAAPLMVMRSDGGVMDVREIERRPILTLLSGPAAGVAGALLHEQVTDGIFIEVGGTSSDCSAIRAGMPQLRPARVGGHRTLLRTLDVRTLAIAGGSMPRMRGGRIVDVGPRSAHIAGCAYASFSDPAILDGARVEHVSPAPGDPADYPIFIARDGTRIAVTPTCASNMLGFVPQGAFARGNAAAAARAFELLAGSSAAARVLAESLLEVANSKLIAAIDELIADYELDRETLTIVGGGGGAAALVPFAAQRSHLDFRLARDAEVISPIGVALALVRESIERVIVDPAPEDILRLRRQAQDAVVASGASPESVQVAVEIDAQRNTVRAVASGATEIAQSSAQAMLSPQALREQAVRLLRAPEAAVREVAAVNGLTVYAWERSKRSDLRILDRMGVGRLGLRDARIRRTTALKAAEDLREMIESATAFGDVGRALPEIYVLHGARIADFSGLASAEQAVALAEEELAGRAPDDAVVLLACPRLA